MKKILIVGTVTIMLITASWFWQASRTPIYASAKQSIDVTPTYKPIKTDTYIENSKLTPEITQTAQNQTHHARPIQQIELRSNEAPPIASNSLDEARFSGDLDNHQSYLSFEANNERQLKQNYIFAAKRKAMQLQQYLLKGEQTGLSNAELEFAKEKIAALQTLANQLESELKQ